MSEYPILFSAPMIRAMARKTNTRRMSEQWMKVKAGDRLWVREMWRTLYGYNDHPPSYIPSSEPVWFDADGKCPWLAAGKGRPSIFMPRWASRITLEATEDARREPLADISEADAIAEGIFEVPGKKGIWDGGGPAMGNTPQMAFWRLWDSLHGKDAPVSSDPSPVRIAFRVLP